MADVKPLQGEVKIIDNASRAFNAIRDSILGSSGALDSFINVLGSYQNLNIRPIRLTSRIETITDNKTLYDTPALSLPETPVPDAPAFKEACDAIEQTYTDLADNITQKTEPLETTLNAALTTVTSTLTAINENISTIAGTLTKTVSGAADELKNIGNAGRNEIDDTCNATRKLKEEVEKVDRKAKHAGLSLASIGQAYWGIMGIAAGFQQFSGIFQASDRQARMDARLGLLTEEQRGAAYAGKEDGSGYTVREIDSAFTATANKLGVDKNQFAGDAMMFMTGTGGAFANIGEASKFTELLTKQFTISGASGEQVAGASEQLRQGMSKGALDMQDFRSLMSSAPQIGDLIAKKLDISVSELNQAVTDKKITGNVLKGALFENAEKINEQFEELPMTWERVTASMKNKFMEAAQPILEKIGEIASSDSFQGLLATVLSLGGAFFDMVGMIIQGIQPLKPILDGVLSAFSFMIGAVSENIKLFTALAGTALGIAVAYKVITGWQQIIIALQKTMAATNPFLLMATAIIAAIVALKHFWDTNIEFRFAIKEMWENMQFYFALGVNKFIGGIKSIIGSILMSLGDMLREVQLVANKLLEVYDFLNRTNSEKFSFGDAVWEKGMGIASNQSGKEDERRLRWLNKFNLDQLRREKSDALKKARENAENKDKPQELAYGQTPSKPLHTKGNTKIDKDSIQLLKDIASVELVNRYTTIRPKVRVNVGTINNEADADAFFDRFAGEIENANASSLSEVYA